MPTVIAHHDVKDKDHWLASPKREEVFGPLGVTNIRTFVDPQNPTRVAVLMDVADMDVVMGAMQNKEMAEAMEYDGVLAETVVGRTSPPRGDTNSEGPASVQDEPGHLCRSRCSGTTPPRRRSGYRSATTG